MAINRENNRLGLYNAVKASFNVNGKIIPYDKWKSTWFQSQGMFCDNPLVKDKNDNVKQINLFDALTSSINGHKPLRDYYFKSDDPIYLSLKDKATFYRTYACFDFEWSKKSIYCKDAQVSDNTSSIVNSNSDLNVYTGTFQDIKTTTMFSISLNNSKLFVDVMDIKKEYPNIELVPTVGKNTFEVALPQMSDSTIINKLTSLVKGKIIFSDDLKTLTYSFGSILSGTASKIEGDNNNVNKNKTNTNNTSSDSSDKKTDKKVKSDDDQKYKLYQNTINFGPDKPFKVDNIRTKPCSDFPFTFGCQNTLIGDINQVFFNNRLSDVYDSHLDKELEDNGWYKDIGEKKGEISKKMYDQIMTLKENKLQKKIIKETVKKVLKEYIIRK